MSGRVRLDEALVAAGLSPTRSRARDTILRGGVRVDGEVEAKPARLVAPSNTLALDDPAAGYVSRAALKLIEALDRFGFDPAGLTVLDLGASTGGFTQVLLQRGAAEVLAVDVGHDQLDATVAADPRVRRFDGLNGRDLSPAAINCSGVDAVVADVSFISLRLALPPALRLASASRRGISPGGNDSSQTGWLVALVKPQFEVGRDLIGKGGIVRDSLAAQASAESIAEWIEQEHGWTVLGLVPSPIPGGDGNREWLLGATKPQTAGP